MTTAIQSVRDLAEANAATLAASLPTVEQWLPELIASVSWSVRLSPHFMLSYYHDASRVALMDQDAFLAECERCREQILQHLGISPSNKMERDALKSHLSLLIMHTTSAMTFGNLLKPHLLLYLLDRERDPDYMAKFRHEIAHWVWGSLYGEAPAFLNEGVAVVVETLPTPATEAALFANLRPLAQVPPLEDLCKNETFWKTGTAFYRIAGTFVYLLSQRWGWERVAELFRHTSYEDTAIGDHFAQVYGISLQEADTQWREFVRAKAGKGNGRQE